MTAGGPPGVSEFGPAWRGFRMDGLKEVLSFLGAVFGLISALIPLFGYLADRRRRVSVAAETCTEVSRSRPEDEPGAAAMATMVPPAHAPHRPRHISKGRTASPNSGNLHDHRRCTLAHDESRHGGHRFHRRVRRPAGNQASTRQSAGSRTARAIRRSRHRSGKAGRRSQHNRRGDRWNTILLAGDAVAIWSGYNMLRLRNYWLALAGSIALMPGSCMCCLLGLPSGIWSFVVLVDPDVRAAFREAQYSLSDPSRSSAAVSAGNRAGHLRERAPTRENSLFVISVRTPRVISCSDR